MTFGYIGLFTGTEELIWKTEGPTDMLAIVSLIVAQDPPPNHAAVCNACGAGESPMSADAQTFVRRIAGAAEVFVVHDCDKPGQAGATWVQNGERRRPGWATAIAQHNRNTRNVVLPYTLEDSHGRDVRDWIIEQQQAGKQPAEIYAELINYARTRGELIELAENAIATIENEEDSDEKKEKQKPKEAPEDPHRLARINIDRYQLEHNGTLRYWRQQWFKYKGGKYHQLSKDELLAKVTASIKREFDALWEEEIDRYQEWRESDDYDEKKDKGEPVCRQVKETLVNNVVAAMRSICLLTDSHPMPCWIPERSQPHFLSVSNGILDLDGMLKDKPTDEILKPHTPEWFSLLKLDYPYNTDATCDLWEQFLDYAMEGDQERISLLQEWAGYLLTSTNDYQKFMVLEGDGGNGKTVFFAGITAMLGTDNVSHVSLERFGGQFDLTSTLGKAANISGDTGEIEIVAEGVLKQFTGGDTMQFDRKNRDMISARPTAKLMCSWNARPRFRDKSSGIWRRMLLVPFNRPVDPARKVVGMDLPEWWKKRDQLSGMLNWAIVGLSNLLERGEFVHSTISANALDDYREESNPVIQFLNQCITHLPPSTLEYELQKPERDQRYVSSTTLYLAYREWCATNGLQPMNSSNFGKQVIRKFGNIRYRKTAGDREYVYRLICFRKDFE